MNALRHDFDLAHAEPLGPAVTDNRQDRMRQQWLAAQEAAGAIARLAQLAAPELAPCAALELAIAAGDAARLARCEQMLEDLTAVLHTGLTALLFAAENDCDTTAAALTLWREYGAATTAFSALAAAGPALGDGAATLVDHAIGA